MQSFMQFVTTINELKALYPKALPAFGHVLKLAGALTHGDTVVALAEARAALDVIEK